MRILQLDIDEFLTAKIYDPSPHRLLPDTSSVGERSIPISYNCESCDTSILFQTEDFEKHASKQGFTNFNKSDSEFFEVYLKAQSLMGIKNI